MKDLLAKENRSVLEQLAFARALLAFDFDGTLAPIVKDRDVARMRPRTSELLTALCSRYPCAVISGRSAADLSPRLEGAPVQYVVGNHGMEPGGDLSKYEQEVAATRPLLEAALGNEPGVELEDKRYSLALHYRRSRHKQAAVTAITRAIAALPIAMRTIAGKMVINVVPASAANKGDALLELRERAGADIALYVGDDVTDEDVFKIDQPGRLLSVRIGEAAWSAAAYCLRTQRQVDRLLATLVALRENPPTA